MAVHEDDTPPEPKRSRSKVICDWLVMALLVAILTATLCGLGSFAAGYLVRRFLINPPI